MTKYEELSELLSGVYDQRDDLEEKSKHFGMEIIKGLIKYLECDPEKLIFSKPHHDCNDDCYDSMRLYDAIELQSDNLWHFNLQIEIKHEIKGEFLSTCYYLGIKPKADYFVLQFFNKDENPIKDFFIFPTNEKDEKIKLYEYIYNDLKESINDFKYPLEY